MCKIWVTVTFLCTFAAGEALGQADSWKTVSSLGVGRSGAAAVYLDGYVYVAGGASATSQILDIVERYDVAGNVWETLPSRLRRPRKNAAMAVLDGRLVVIGGRDDEGNVLKSVEVYDPGDPTDGWKSFSDLEERREGAQAVFSAGVLHVLGGSDENGAILQSVELYNAAEDDWGFDSLWTLEAARAAFAASSVADSVFVVGGFDTFGPVAPVERYHEGAGNAIVASLGQPRGNLASTSKGDSLVVAGGRTSTNQVVARVDYFVAGSNLQLSGPPLIEARERFALVAAEQRVYAIGGSDPFGSVLSSVELLDLTRGVGTVDESPDRLEGGLMDIFPNPATDHIVFRHRVATQIGRTSLEVVDILGRRVALLAIDRSMPGETRWDLRDHAGSNVPAGLYLARLTGSPRNAAKKFLVVR